MTWSYSAGTSTPNLAGLVEFNGVRLNDGSYTLTSLGGLDDGAPVRGTASPLPASFGGIPLTPFYDSLEFTLEGYLEVTTLSDIWAARDYLKQAFNLNSTALQTLTVNTSGWTATRQVLARVAGPITFAEPTLVEKNDLARDFSIPMIAPDPRLYSTTQHDTVIALGGSGTQTTVTNAGTVPTPFTVKFTGPITNPQIVLNATGNPQIYFGGTYAIASGHYVTVSTNPAADGGITAVDDTGANVWGNVGTFTVKTIPAGTSQWFVGGTGTSGATQVELIFRDSWA